MISGLQSLEIDSNDMKKLSQLSRERPVREGDEEESEGSAAKWWREGKRFERAYEGVRRQLFGSDQVRSTRSHTRSIEVLMKRVIGGTGWKFARYGSSRSSGFGRESVSLFLG